MQNMYINTLFNMIDLCYSFRNYFVAVQIFKRHSMSYVNWVSLLLAKKSCFDFIKSNMKMKIVRTFFWPVTGIFSVKSIYCLFEKGHPCVDSKGAHSEVWARYP